MNYSDFTHKSSAFQQAIDTVEALPLEDQAVLLNILEKRLQQRRREEVVQAVQKAREDYAAGNFRSGSVADLLAEIDNCQD